MFKLTIKKLAFVLTLLASNANAESVAISTNNIDINNRAGLALNSDDFYFRINGRLMVDFATWQGAAFSGAENENGSGSEIRRSRIYLKGKYHDWQYRLQTNFNKNGASNSNTYIAYSGFESFDIFIGKHAEPLGLESANSSKYIAAIERSITGNSHFAGDRELGVSIAGNQSNYSYQLGFYDVASTATDTNLAVTGRFTYLPIINNRQTLHLGIAASVRQLDENNLFEAKDRAGVHPTDIKSITTGQFHAKSSQVINAELSYIHDSWHVTAEYLSANFEEVEHLATREFSSHYVQTSYFFTHEQRPYDIASGTFLGVTPNNSYGAWEAFVRMERIDFNDHNYGSEAQITTAGLNYFATKYTRLSLNYVYSDIQYAANTHNGASIDGSALNFRAQFYW